MNSTESSSFLSGWIRYDVLLVLGFILCVWLLNYIPILFQKVRVWLTTAPPLARPIVQDLGPEKRLEKLIRSGTKLTVYTYNELLETYVCTRQFEKMEALFADIKSKGVDERPNIDSYNILLRGLVESAKDGKHESMNRVYVILKEMNEAKINPSLGTFRHMMEICEVTNDKKALWGIFDRMHIDYKVEADTAIFFLLMNWLKAPLNSVPLEYTEVFYERLFDHVGKTQIGEDFIILTIDACIKASSENCKKAARILIHFASYKLPLPLCCYGKLLTYFAQSKNAEKVLELHTQMQAEGIKLNDITYGCLLEAFLQCGRTDKIIELYESPTKDDMKPFNVVIFTTLIRAYAKGRKFEKVMTVYEKVKSRNSTKLNLIAYNALLDCCVQCEQYEVMEKILFNMIEEGKLRTAEDALIPDIITYSTIIKGLCKSEQLDKALKLYREMKEKEMKLDEVVFNSLLDGCVKHKGDIETAMELVADMETYGISRSNYTYSILIKLYTRMNDIGKTLGVYQEMKHKGIVPGIIVYTCLLQACIKSKDIMKALEIFNEMKRAGVSPDQVAYNTIINGCVYSGKLLQGCEVLCEAISMNMRLADDIYNNVLKNLLSYRSMSAEQKHQYATYICNYIALNKVNANQEYYYQVLNTLVFSAGGPVAAQAGYASGYYDPASAWNYQEPYGNYYYYYPNQQ